MTVSGAPLRVVPLVVLLLVLPSAHAAADPRVHEDAASCLEALGIDLADGAERDSTCVVAYAHATDHFMLSAPLTTQRPPDEAPRLEWGFHQPTVTPFWDLSSIDFRLASGHVEYSDSGLVRRTDPVDLDVHDGAPWWLYVYLTVDQTEIRAPEVPDAAPDAGFLPCVTVRAELVSGVEGVTTVLSRSEVLADLSRPVLPFSTPVCPAGDFPVDGDGVVTVGLQLPGLQRDIVSTEHVVVRLTVFSEEADDGTQVLPQGLRWVHGPHHPTRLVVPIDDAVRVDALAMMWSDGRLHMRANITSPWGDHDVDAETLAFDVVDGSGQVVASRSDGTLGGPELRWPVYAHGVHPVQATVQWDLVAARLTDGDYTFRVTAGNGQHTARTSAETTFTLADAGSMLTLRDLEGNVTGTFTIAKAQEAPFFAPAFVLLALGLLLMALRRR